MQHNDHNGIGKKISEALNAKAQLGKHHNSIAPFGYQPSKEDPFVWAIDEPAAEIVHEIFHMRMSGMGYLQIAKALYNRKLDNPEVYARKRDGKQLPQYKYPTNRWYAATVIDILENREYLGIAVTKRMRVKSYKSSTKIRLPVEEWTMFEGAHPAIIDQETFDAVNQMSSGRKRPVNLGDKGVLNGKLYCADCGDKLHIRRSSSGKNIKHTYYICNRNRAYVDGYGDCTPHSVRKDVIEQRVLTDIQRVIAFARDSESRFVDMTTRKLREEKSKNSRRMKIEYSKTLNRIARLDVAMSKLHEDFTQGEHSADRFAKLLDIYRQEHAELTARMNKFQPIEEAADLALGIDSFLQIAKSVMEIETLTSEVVDAFIEKIIVGEAVIVKPRKYAKNVKYQDITIVYSYIGVVPQTGETVSAET